MESSYDTIKERLKTILESERTIEFLNKLTDFGISLSNAVQITNKFINEVFQGEGIKIVNRNNRKRFINNILIDNKKILIKTNSVTNRYIKFKTLKYEKQDQIDFSNLKNNINNDLNNFDYLFLIRIEENYNEEFDELKVCYNFYLFSSEYFKIKENFPRFLNRSSFSGNRWLFKNYNEFYLRYDIGSLMSFNICRPYISQ